ncbi:hypothetical protein HK101_002221 [Irineochytrium annulatum]|nr:hypothetical protein HK101_002221 [Irineochytrium annulatum]
MTAFSAEAHALAHAVAQVAQANADADAIDKAIDAAALLLDVLERLRTSSRVGNRHHEHDGAVAVTKAILPPSEMTADDIDHLPSGDGDERSSSQVKAEITLNGSVDARGSATATSSSIAGEGSSTPSGCNQLDGRIKAFSVDPRSWTYVYDGMLMLYTLAVCSFYVGDPPFTLSPSAHRVREEGRTLQDEYPVFEMRLDSLALKNYLLFLVKALSGPLFKSEPSKSAARPAHIIVNAATVDSLSSQLSTLAVQGVAGSSHNPVGRPGNPVGRPRSWAAHVRANVSRPVPLDIGNNNFLVYNERRSSWEAKFGNWKKKEYLRIMFAHAVRVDEEHGEWIEKKSLANKKGWI